MVDTMTANSDALWHQLYLDNFSNNYDLMIKLAEKDASDRDSKRKQESWRNTKHFLYQKDAEEGKTYIAKWSSTQFLLLLVIGRHTTHYIRWNDM